MLTKFLESIDIFKIYFALYFREKRQQSSIFGSIFSLLIFSFLIYQFVNSELFIKRSPNVLTESFAGTHAESIEFNDQRILLMGIIDSQLNRYADPSLFKIVATYFDNYNITTREIKLLVLN